MKIYVFQFYEGKNFLPQEIDRGRAGEDVAGVPLPPFSAAL